MRFDTTSDITFRKLSIFMTFMEKGNIARTAETLGLSGVSVHRALHTLEENVRCPLFTHKGRNLIALPSAWTLLEYCQEVMQVMERGLEESRKIAGIGQGRLRVGTLYSLTLETVPRLIMGMKLRRPDLEMDLTMGSNDTLLHMLKARWTRFLSPSPKATSTVTASKCCRCFMTTSSLPHRLPPR